MINVIGQLLGSSGYANHTRGLVNELNKLTECKLTTNLVPGFERQVNDQELEMIKRQEDYDINLIITHPLHWRANLSAKRNWVYLVWEGDKIPQWILEECMNENIEKIIVPSQHTRQAVANTTYSEEHNKIIDKLVVIPHGHNPEVFYPISPVKYEGLLGDLQDVTHAEKIEADPSLKDGEVKVTFSPFRFLANKGLRNLEDRGGLQYLIKAYLEEFTKKDNVELTLKINPAYGIPNLLEMFPELKNPDNPKIIYIHEEYTTKQLNELYNQCDVFVSPTRAEAFNIPCLEAMACGKPVITTNYGGQTDYVIDGQTGVLLDYDLVDVTHEVEYEETKWAIPKHEDLRKALRSLYQHRDNTNWRAQSNNCIEEARKLTWANTAKQIYEMSKL